MSWWRRVTRSDPRSVNAALTDALRATWAIGWQPVDVWQVVRRRLDGKATDFLLGAIAEEAAHYAEPTVHPRWRAQLAELDATRWWPAAQCFVEAYAARNNLNDVDVHELATQVLHLLRILPPQPKLLPPPGSHTGAAAREDPAPGVDPKLLAKIRGLLAKAESTQFDEEADAFFAKAQELMSKYSLERGALEAPAQNGEPGVRTGGRRLWLENPYLGAKSMLVGTVAKANRCRAVLQEDPGFVTVLGEETDLELVEVLTTSLLVQAGKAMLAAGRRVDHTGTSRTRSFRQAFLVSYAGRIGERLNEASQRAEAEVSEAIGETRLLPVLAAKEHAVQQLLDRHYPKLATRRVSISNAAGWHAGRAAADLAVLDARRALGN